MNRKGLLIALGLFGGIGLVFGLFPSLDLWLAGLFYDSASKSFPLRSMDDLEFARDLAMWIAWAFAGPSILALIYKMIWPDRPLVMPVYQTVKFAFDRLDQAQEVQAGGRANRVNEWQQIAAGEGVGAARAGPGVEHRATAGRTIARRRC